MAMIIGRACHLVFGFLGAGKTSLINACIWHNKPDNWAVLVNEIGQIGIDAHLLDKQVAVRQISGGCICCTSQLPLQVALVRLLSEHKPDRLWIEPTGLARSKALLDELSAPHWQQALSIKSVIVSVNAKQWQNPRYRHHADYIDHIRCADVLVINRTECLNDDENHELMAYLKTHNEQAACIIQAETNWLEQLCVYLDKPSQQIANHSSIISPILGGHFKLTSTDKQNTIVPPYYYHNYVIGVSVVGWCLPANWQAQLGKLIDWLTALDNWQRIKGVINTTDGWQTLNFSPDSLCINSVSGGVDNRLELIFDKVHDDNYTAQLNKQLMVLFNLALFINYTNSTYHFI